MILANCGLGPTWLPTDRSIGIDQEHRGLSGHPEETRRGASNITPPGEFLRHGPVVGNALGRDRRSDRDDRRSSSETPRAARITPGTDDRRELAPRHPEDHHRGSTVSDRLHRVLFHTLEIDEHDVR